MNNIFLIDAKEMFRGSFLKKDAKYYQSLYSLQDEVLNNINFNNTKFYIKIWF